MPSLSHWLTKTMASDEDAARAAAVEAFVPSLNCTFAPGAKDLIAFSGEDGTQITGAQPGGFGLPSVSAGPPTGSTCAEPPPESTPMSECDPMTAIDGTLVLSGSMPVFFNRTAPCSSSSCAIAASPVTSMA